ncbi:hypothetical protein [Altererythrobacter sp. MF3-039]|uniref:hypothetical protein n=1 Tax=Altererythrobacter sp. MF3-039 TaxID=3252901 RepID=UPI00390C7036
MNLEAIYFISQVVAAVALVGSLVFVGIQIREARKQAEHAERTAKAQVFQQITDAYRLEATKWTSQPDIYRIVLEGRPLDAVTQEERTRLAGLFFSSMHLAQNIYFQHKSGLLPDRAYRSYIAFLASLCSRQTGKAWWESRRPFFDDEFAGMIDEEFSKAHFLGGDRYHADENQGHASHDSQASTSKEEVTS